jgi:hypothetical protein
VQTLNPGYSAEVGGAAAASKRTFASAYTVNEKLGKGNYATVYRVVPKDGSSSKSFAAKCIKKRDLTKEDIDALAVEVQAMKLLKSHPNFVHMQESLSEKCVQPPWPPAKCTPTPLSRGPAVLLSARVIPPVLF